MKRPYALKILNSGVTPRIANWIDVGNTDVFPFRLYTSFFIHPEKSRQAEYETCILGNAFLEQHVLVDTDEAEQWLVANAPKVHIHRIGHVPLFQDFFDIAENGYLNIVSNADILFNETIVRAQYVCMDNVVLCIGKWEEVDTNTIIPYTDLGSQDAWIWKGVLSVPRNFNFRMGTPGCDNRIAGELTDAGYKIANVMMDIVTIHKHKTEIRSYPAEAVPPPYATVDHTHFVVPNPPTANLNILPFTPVDTLIHVGYPMSELQDAFRNVCANYIFFHRDLPTLNTDLVNACYAKNPSIVFCQIQAAGVLDIDVVKSIQRTSYIINWTGDARRPIPTWYKEYAPYFDITLFSNETDVLEMQSLGYRSAFWNIGFETKLYNPLSRMNTSYDILFMGNNYPGGFPLSMLRSTMVNTLKSIFGVSFGVYGSGWGTSSTNEIEEASLYRGSKMAISLSHYDLERYFSDRMLRIMGSSTLCLAKWYPGIEKDFIDRVHLVVWMDIPDLIAKIKYYLAHPKERFIIARGGFLRVLFEHSWPVRVQQLEYIMQKNPKRIIPSVKKGRTLKFLRI